MKVSSDFLDIDLLDSASLRAILDSAAALKLGAADLDEAALKGKVLALIFERPSTRTRVSFQVAMSQMGGETVVLAPEDTQLGRGESMADTARVLSEYVDGIMIRAESHDTLHELARFSRVPVINGLTDKSHPCQLMADIMTFEEHSGPITGRVVAWSGDGNNVLDLIRVNSAAITKYSPTSSKFISCINSRYCIYCLVISAMGISQISIFCSFKRWSNRSKGPS